MLTDGAQTTNQFAPDTDWNQISIADRGLFELKTQISNLNIFSLKVFR